MAAAPKPTPNQRAVLEQLAARPPKGARRVAELEVSSTRGEHSAAIATVRGRSDYLQRRKISPVTLRSLRAAGWIEEIDRWIVAQVTHGKKQWQAEHVEYAITLAGRAAIAPRPPKR
jgi:EAL domain-containing protein (putative c-di-GMP-specific phosphodiesterase class I)